MSAPDVAALEAIVGAGNVLQGDLYGLRNPGYTRENLAAGLLVRPGNTAEVSALLRYLYRAGIPIVPHGGLTGLVLGAVSKPGDVIVNLERMNRIERVDPVDRVLVAEAGVTLETAQRASEEHHLMVPVDIAARGSATLGGNVATNAGGQRVMRYGMTRDMILGLEVVLPDGEVLCMMSGLVKNNAGYDLKQLFIGSEGTLGIVTRVVMRLHEAPARVATALAACQSFEQIPPLLRHASQHLGGKLTSFEMLDPKYYATTARLSFIAAPIAPAHGSYAILEASGAESDDVDADLEATLATALDEGLILDAVTAKSEAERQAIWTIRENSEPIERLTPACWSYDISLPLSRFAEYLAVVQSTLASIDPEPDFYYFGHVADGNLHLMVGSQASDEDMHRRIEEIVYTPLKTLGGSASAEHGIGLERRHLLNVCRSEGEIALMRRVKSILDPKGLMNAGKVLG
jgi:FAD/FMN-containing dehydrogenase